MYSAMNRLKKTSTLEYEWFEQLAFEGFRQMEIQSINVVEVKYFTLNDEGYIDMPHNYVNYSKIGFISKGRIINLGLNNAMALPEGLPYCETPPHLVDIDADQNYLMPVAYVAHWRHNNPTYTTYGYGGGYAEGYYRVDNKNRRIYISDRVPGSEIVMEFVGVGDLCGETYIPAHYEEALRLWLIWQNIENDNRVNGGEKERKKNQYELSYAQAHLNSRTITVQEILDAIYSGQHQGIK